MSFIKRFYPLFFAVVFLFSIAPASASTFGKDQLFFISPQYDARSRIQITATLKHISTRANFYVEDEHWNGIDSNARSQVLDRIISLGREFDERIYPVETQFFGPEPNPGVDNDPRITILLSPLIENAGGYFDTANCYKKAEAPNSNEREIIYLNIAGLGDSMKINAFLAHEFQHLISFNQREKLRNISDDTWLNEMRSEYAVTLLGYNGGFSGSHLEKRLRSFIENPSDSLTEWKNLPADYGQIGLFGEYLAERWSPKIIADTLKNSSVGIASINNALKQNGFSDSFADIFGQWMAANILNNSSVDSKFGYNLDGLKTFHIASTKTFYNLGDDIAFAASDAIKDWQGRWYEISQFASGRKNVLKINFSSPSLASFYIPFLVFKTGGSQIFSVFNPAVRSGPLYINGIGGEVSKIVFMPVKKDKISGFTANEIAIPFTFSIERAESVPQEMIIPTSAPSPTSISLVNDAIPPLPGIADGSLIRAEGDYKVYIVNGGWRRHIISPRIFSFYPQFGFDKVRVVAPSVLAQYRESNLVRYQLGQKVYSIDKSGDKHWLNMTAEQFTSSGRDWGSIFIINLPELNFYKPSL